MGFELYVLWQAVSLINLKMKRMLAFENRYFRRNSTSVVSTVNGPVSNLSQFRITS